MMKDFTHTRRGSQLLDVEEAESRWVGRCWGLGLGFWILEKCGWGLGVEPGGGGETICNIDLLDFSRGG